MDTILLGLQDGGASTCDHIIPVPSSKFYVESPSKDLYPLHHYPTQGTSHQHCEGSNMVVSSLVPRLFPPPVLDHLQCTNTERENLEGLVMCGDIR